MRKTLSATLAVVSLTFLVFGVAPVSALSNTCNFGTVTAFNLVCSVGTKSCVGPCTLTTKCTISGTGLVACRVSGDVAQTCGTTLATCTVTSSYFAPSGTTIFANAHCTTSPSLSQVTIATNVQVTCSIN